MNLDQHPVSPPRLVALARDTFLSPRYPFPDPDLPPLHVPRYGNDFVFGTGGSVPLGYSAGTTEAVLKPKMERLLSIFAAGDQSGMARRLFDRFLSKQVDVTYFNDPDLSQAAAGHPHIRHFCRAALGAPQPNHPPPTATRIHQALKRANWNVQRVTAPSDLGVPAFNRGSKIWTTGDFNNGLGLMINGVQYVYVVATHYHHDAAARIYRIRLRYYFYDVFGLDDEDVVEYGANEGLIFRNTAGIGITAWWQLQHQFAYAPLVTRFVLDQTFQEAAV